MKATIAFLAAITLVAAGAAPSTKPSSKVVSNLSGYVFVLDKYDIEVPAQDAALLTSLVAYEGMPVIKDDPLAQMDDIEPKMRKRIAELEMNAAQKKADNRINEQYAYAAAKVAEADYARDKEANRSVRGTITESQLKRDELEWNRARLQIKQAAEDRVLADLTAKAKAAEVEAAEKAIERRLIKAPIDGEVTRVYRHAGEWVKPGDPILQIKRFDTLRVKTTLMAADFLPIEIEERAVIAQVILANDRSETFQGVVSWVDPEIQGDGAYAVWADVVNRKEAGKWLLRPGQSVMMAIQLK